MDENYHNQQPGQQGANYAPQQQPQTNYGPQQQPQTNYGPQQQPQTNYGPQQPPFQQIYHVHAPEKKTNGIGTAGFVLALLGVILSWVPVLGWILWLLGLIFSGVGLSKQPKGLAIAGLVISLISLVILILVIGVFAGAAASYGLF